MCLSEFSFFPAQFDETMHSKQDRKSLEDPRQNLSWGKKKLIIIIGGLTLE